MDKNIFKNIEFEKVLSLSSLVDYCPGQVVSRTLIQNSAVSITLFSFGENEEIGSHKSDGDAMLTVLEGSAKITIGETEYSLKGGETIVMPADVPHAVKADGNFKMLLVVVFNKQ